MSMSSVQPIPFPLAAQRSRPAAPVVVHLPTGQMLSASAPPPAALHAETDGTRWHAELAAHAAGIDTLLKAAAKRVGVVLTRAERAAIVWRALGQIDPAVREVAIHKGKRAFLAALGSGPEPPRFSLVDDAVRAGIDGYEARLALGRIR